jgi:hypothetical protein
MHVWVSFSGVFRFVLWLLVAGILAGVLIVGESGDEPVGQGEGVTFHADTRDR